uniref:Uncharacterized protein n=1 Tax=Parasitella parasitica TaxID=35722 RepID=Q8J0K2_9FUNG|nr:hypothetical protein [Parasitella parasitica]
MNKQEYAGKACIIYVHIFVSALICQMKPLDESPTRCTVYTEISAETKRLPFGGFSTAQNVSITVCINVLDVAFMSLILDAWY